MDLIGWGEIPPYTLENYKDSSVLEGNVHRDSLTCCEETSCPAAGTEVRLMHCAWATIIPIYEIPCSKGNLCGLS